MCERCSGLFSRRIAFLVVSEFIRAFVCAQCAEEANQFDGMVVLPIEALLDDDEGRGYLQ